MHAPSTGLQTSSVQTLLSLQILALPGLHTPVAEQVSVMVHSLPSSQPVPVGREVVTHVVADTGLHAWNLQLS